MTRLFVIDDRDQTVEMCHKHLPQFDYVTRCHKTIPCQVCEERDRGCPLKCAHDYLEAEETLARLETLPDLVVLDLHFAIPEDRLLPVDKGELPLDARARRKALESLRRTQGIHILSHLRARYPSLPVVLLTTTHADLGELRPTGPLLYFCENEVVDSRTLSAEITRALSLHHDTQEGNIFWGKNRAMAELRQQVDILSRSPLPVLIEGETGVGKSYLAEHVLHPRSGVKGPLVITDLSTVPPSLLPSHLFGARRGSFTGAVEDTAGVFERAHAGTLFLDEIGNIDLDLQRQLLLVLERGEVTRIGDSRPRPAQVKLVAATNQDLALAVREGRFRADLYMRLNPAMRLHVPPLRERREDLPALIRFAFAEALESEALLPLVRSFLARFPTPSTFRKEDNRILSGKPNAKLASSNAFTVFLEPRMMKRLCEYSWPGNHRELRLLAINALVSNLVLQLNTGPTSRLPAPAILTITALDTEPLLLTKSERPNVASTDARGNSLVSVRIGPGRTFAEVSSDVERQYLRALFKASEGDLERMARLLLGPNGSARKMHLRLNQLGLRLRELRGGE